MESNVKTHETTNNSSSIENDSWNEEKQEFKIQIEKEETTKKLINSKEVDELISTISVYEPDSIVSFGGNAAEEIAKCSDDVLKSIDMSKINDTGELLIILGKIMDKFDISEIKENKSIFQKLLGNMKKQLEKILEKYNTMGNEVDKIYVKLKQYEVEIKESNRHLESMFQTNMNYYHDLLKYILAGEQGIKELDEYILQKTAEMEESNDKNLYFEVENLNQAKQMLEQRIQDLRIAENIAMQSIPMLKTMQYSNANLIRKINSAFIITLPIFKQALSQAILLKRQKIQADAMSALDKKTNEMLLKNAQNTVEQSKLTAQLATGNSIKIETLEETWKTIVKGIEETKKIQENASKKRIEDQVRLKAIKEDFNKMVIQK